MKQYFFFILIGVISLTSCDNTMIYGEDVDIKDHVWHKDSILSFESDSLLDLPQVLKIGVTVRNTVDYKYRNLWLFVEIKLPNKETPIRDTLNHALMTAEGFWNENVDGSNIKESVKYYKYAIQNPPKGKYSVKIQHGMRDEFLGEIVSIGTRIEKHEN
jgi:gliding motility-associated lipoprotein GldH